MKLSKLYTNKPDIFTPVNFSSTINVVMAEIRLPENRSKDTHNLGKTLFGRLLDFCLLAGRSERFFLFKHQDLFDDFVFYLEILLVDGSYLTVRRNVATHSKISFMRHDTPYQDFSSTDDTKWDHLDIPFERAKEFLDGALDFRILKPWHFRKGLGYLLRSQDDFHDVFQLRKFQSKHVDWKPFLAHLLGFNGELAKNLYEKEIEFDEKKKKAQTIQAELGGSVEDLSKIEGLLHLKRTEADQKQRLLDAFDFRASDKEKTKQVVEELDYLISKLNGKRYTLSQSRKKIASSLEDDKILFDPNEAQRIFEEAQVLFPDQLKKDYDTLIEFNRAITDERRQYLLEERKEIDKELLKINSDLDELGKRRSEALAYLTDADVYKKFKKTSDDLIGLKADITTLERQRGFLTRLQELRKQLREIDTEKSQLQAQIEENIETVNTDKESLFSNIRLYFSEVVDEVIDRKALLEVKPNNLGHFEFQANILDESGNATSADMGHTYRKLMCAAFDLAVLRAYLGERSPRFLYHDGIFESLDDRKKLNLVDVMQRYSSLGIQFIVTLIDSDLPPVSEEDGPVFTDEEIVLRLHDEGPDGRLFKMKSW